ncbi:tyrosine--tRNA ligase [Arcobacter arenosus]|uniref:tyrosine--tRNA ligase n=1 Tax=Arcobacter arenosus TaxID=2576037 RepID=UPI003BACFD32
MNNKQIKKILDRGVITNILPTKEEFTEILLKKKLRFYIGADATSDSLHLSHAKNYQLLEEFRQLGHEVIVLFGDFTARIGDPTDKSSTRTKLTKEEVRKNVSCWLEQIQPLLNFNDPVNPAKVKYNSEWLSLLNFEDILELASNFTVGQLLERDMFTKRMNADKPIFMHEFMYPMMQGYDSVAIDVDVELCGTDQTFNALVGRKLQKNINNKDKFVVTVNLMENPETGELMSKSRGTGIFLKFDSFDMFGALMSQPDEMIKVFLVNNTRISLSNIDDILNLHPRDAKIKMAFEVTKIMKGEEEALKAKTRFINQFQKKVISEKDMVLINLKEKEMSLFELLKNLIGIHTSSSEILRLIKQNSISINNIKKSNKNETIQINDLIVKVGKRRYFKVN